MVKPYTGPAGRDMTVLADIGCGDVSGRVARGCAAVVTNDTGSAYCRMIKPYTGPAGRDMAVLADIGYRYVTGGFAR